MTIIADVTQKVPLTKILSIKVDVVSVILVGLFIIGIYDLENIRSRKSWQIEFTWQCNKFRLKSAIIIHILLFREGVDK